MIAARGTSSVDDSSHAYTTLADASYVTGQPNFALQSETLQFANFVSQIATAYPNAQITLTGYSLGGGIAQIVGYYANTQTVTFLSPGSQQFLSTFDDSLSFLATENILTPATVMANYRQVGDLISLIGTQVGTQINVQTPQLQGFSGIPLEQAIFGNFLGPKSFHGLNPLSSILASQPAVPGVLGSLEQAGTPPDAFVTQTIHFGAINGALASFVVPGILANTIQGFDPGPGFSYSLVDMPGSPAFTSAVLPIGDGAAGWTVTFVTDNGQSGTETSSTGLFDFGTHVRRLDFFPIDASGNPVFYSDPFILGLTFDSPGTFNATLTTSMTSLTNLPLTSGQSCNGIYNGTFDGEVTVSTGQNCMFAANCKIEGNVTVNGGSFVLACAVQGNVTENGGSLVLDPSASVGGNVQISQASVFTLGPSAAIGGNLQIQSLTAGLPQGTVCGTQVKGNLQVQNDASPVEVGGTATQGCPGNSVGGNLLVNSNTAAVRIDNNAVAGGLHVDNDSATTDVSGNSVGKNMECQSNSTVTHTALNMVQGKGQGQCAEFP